jgi:peptidoglycan DL-endopeptidase CwlO
MTSDVLRTVLVVERQVCVRMRSTLPRLALSGLVSLVAVLGGLASSAHADPISDEQAKASAIQNAIETNGERISALSEQYDGAQLHLQQSEQTEASANAQIAFDQAAVVQLRNAIDTRARDLYEKAAAGQSVAALDLKATQQLLAAGHYADAEASQEQEQVAALGAATANLTRSRDEAKAAVTAAAQEADQINQAAQQLEAANQQQYATLAEVQGTLQQLVAQAQQRQEAQNLAQAQARYGTTSSPATTAPPSRSSGSSSASVSGSSPHPPAVPSVPSVPSVPNFTGAPAGSSGAAVAIAFARAQLGKPYEYAAAGPNAYDCSGLTMAAWGAAGVRLPHYSGAQYSMLPHVSLSAMIPGDLVFWGPGGSQHVGLYIGGGLMIAAPTTGDVVKIQAIWGHPIGAARP